jgi:hypothetical protein
MEEAHETAGVNRYAAWVHQSDEGMRAELDGRGYTATISSTRGGSARYGRPWFAGLRPRLAMSSMLPPFLGYRSMLVADGIAPLHGKAALRREILRGRCRIDIPF